MTLAMHKIEQIRVKYRPDGYLCSVPVMREFMGKTCMPVQTADRATIVSKSSP